MQIIHITQHHLFLGGGERLALNWLSNTSINSKYYSRAGGMLYEHPAFLTYKTEQEIDNIVASNPDAVFILHDPFIAERSVFTNRRVVWYIHGAFAFYRDVSACPQPSLIISNYKPKTTHPSYHSLPIVPVPLGVSAREFPMLPVKQVAARVVVGIVGRLSEEKIPLYFFDFIRLFNSNPANLRGFTFRFTGKGMDSPYTKELHRQIDSIPNCSYTGSVAPKEVPAVYQGLDVLVVPSLSETGSYAIVEAQSIGLKVLALNVDGIPNHIVGSSAACVNYDEIFKRLSTIGKDNTTSRKAQHKAAQARHSIDRWVATVDRLAEVVGYFSPKN